MLTTFTVAAQKQWAVELGLGNHTIADEFVDLSDNFYHIDGVVRYNISDRFGVGLYGGFDKVNVENVKSGAETELNYFRASLEGVVDMFNLLHIESTKLNLLSHGGFGVSKYGSTVLPNFSGGITGLVKLNHRLAVKADFSTTAHFNQRYGLDGADRVTNVGTNSFITNSTVGLVVYLGKKKKGDHHDFYIEPKVDEFKTLRNKVRELHAALLAKQRPVNVYQTIEQCECSTSEFVYFENDMPKADTPTDSLIGIQGLNAIEKIYNLASRDSSLKIYLSGTASPTATTTIQYDLELSKRRVEAVKEKLTELGINESRIEINYFGKDNSRDDIHEFARKVSIEVR